MIVIAIIITTLTNILNPLKSIVMLTLSIKTDFNVQLKVVLLFCIKL